MGLSSAKLGLSSAKLRLSSAKLGLSSAKLGLSSAKLRLSSAKLRLGCLLLLECREDLYLLQNMFNLLICHGNFLWLFLVKI